MQSSSPPNTLQARVFCTTAAMRAWSDYALPLSGVYINIDSVNNNKGLLGSPLSQITAVFSHGPEGEGEKIENFLFHFHRSRCNSRAHDIDTAHAIFSLLLAEENSLQKT